jgi:hypothetical protein
MAALVKHGMPGNAVAMLATGFMALVGLMLLYLVLLPPRRGLMRENRRLCRQLEVEHTARGQAAS